MPRRRPSVGWVKQGRTYTVSELWQLFDIRFVLISEKKVISFVLNHLILDGKSLKIYFKKIWTGIIEF